jgi:hypothetical protein
VMDIKHLPVEVHINKGHWKGFCRSRIRRDAPHWNCAMPLPTYLFFQDMCQWCSFTLISIAGPVYPTQTWPGDAADIMSQSVVVLQVSKEAEGLFGWQGNKSDDISGQLLLKVT